MIKKPFYLLFAFLLSNGMLFAQGSPFSWDKELKSYSMGIKAVHLYDLPSNNRDYYNPDMEGLYGDHTNFDIGLDIYGEKFFSPFLGVQLGIRFAGLSGANDIEYYQNSFAELYSDMVLMLTNYNSPPVPFNAYAKIGLGYGIFEARQYLTFDNASDDQWKGGFCEAHLGMGMNYEINSFLRFEMELLANSAFTGSFDGYSGGKNVFPYLTTAIGFSYTFGNKESRPMYSDTYYDKVAISGPAESDSEE